MSHISSANEMRDSRTRDETPTPKYGAEYCASAFVIAHIMALAQRKIENSLQFAKSRPKVDSEINAVLFSAVIGDAREGSGEFSHIEVDKKTYECCFYPYVYIETTVWSDINEVQHIPIVDILTSRYCREILRDSFAALGYSIAISYRSQFAADYIDVVVRWNS